jgi:hypothetical protein
VLLLIASQQSQIDALIPVLIFGLVIGVLGHITHSKTLILTGIFIIGGASVYFGFVLGRVQ